jgi:arylsulfatase A-like enzyme
LYSPVPASPSQPNVILVLADDMGYGDLQVLNPASRIPTPNMDRIASQGLTFTDAHSADAVCTPSRYGLLTGRYCWRTNLHSGVFAGYEPPLIDQGRPTIASVLSEAGYRTGAFGKWHVGLGYRHLDGAPVADRPFPWGVPSEEFERSIDFNARIRGGPLDVGFDEFFGTSGCPTCQTPYGWIEGDRFIDPPTVYETDHPFTGRPGMRSESWSHVDVDPTVIDRSLQFIETNRDAPFFAYVALSAPHEPCINALVPAFARGQSQAGPRGDLVWLVDYAVGRIDAALEQWGIVDDTIVIVTSDNGALPGDRIIDETGTEVYRTYGHQSSGQWRGYKAHIWEGGHREPLLIRWPGRIRPGSTTSNLASLTDLLSTITSLVGAPRPSAGAEDSYDLSAMILSDEAGPRITMVQHSQRGVFALRHGHWKAIFGTHGSGGWPPPAGGPPTEDSVGQLYDLEVDPAEANNLWDTHPELVEELREILNRATGGSRTAP